MMKKTHRKIRPVAAVLVAGCTLALLAGCDKQCHCYGYDGSHHYFTPEEVDESGSSCANMIYFENFRLYSICEWDY